MLLYSLYCCKIIIIIIIVIVIVIIIYQNLNHLSIKKKKKLLLLLFASTWSILYCVLWCIWREWNSRCFEGKERSISQFKLLLLHTLLEWSSFINLFPCSNFLEMLDLCNLCVWCTVIHVHPRCTWTFD